jgi:hypothetical protein
MTASWRRRWPIAKGGRSGERGSLAGNRPIWITEFGCLNNSAPDVQTVVTFFNGAIAMFAKHPRLVRYAWYPWTTNHALVDSAGALTALGAAFAAAPAYK